MITQCCERFAICPDHYGCVQVFCTQQDYDSGVRYGDLRQRGANGNRQAGGLPQNLSHAESVGKHYFGAWGELAVRHLVAPNSGLTVNTFRRVCDLGLANEVSTRSKDWYGAKMTPSHNPGYTFWLAQILTLPAGPYTAHLRGCATGHYIKEHGVYDTWGRDGDPCWMLDPPLPNSGRQALSQYHRH